MMRLGKRGDVGFTLSNVVVLVIVFFLMLVFVIIAGFIGAARADAGFGTDFGKSADRSFLFREGVINTDGEDTNILVFEALAKYWLDREKLDKSKLNDFFKDIISKDNSDNVCFILNQVDSRFANADYPVGDSIFLRYEGGEFRDILVPETFSLNYQKLLEDEVLVFETLEQKIEIQLQYYYGECLEQNE